MFTTATLTALLPQACVDLPVAMATPTTDASGDPGSGSYVLLLVYLALAIGVSFLCSLVEAGILSIRKPQILVLVGEGKRSGRFLDAMHKNIERPLAAILTLNTFAHTFGAAGVGAESLAIFGEAWLAAVSVIVTLAILVFSEIIPKTLGAVYATPLAGFTAYTVQGMIWVSWPLVVVLEALSKLLRGSHREAITREEVAVIADMGRETGALEEGESRVIRNLLQLDQVPVEDVMTPRPVVFSIGKDMTIGEFVEQHGAAKFTRIPITGTSIDDIVGVVLRRDLYRAGRDGTTDATVASFATPLHAVPKNVSVATALNEFTKRQEHMFLVVDEFGGTAGVVTLEDALETLLGVEIVDETDSVEDMRKLAREFAEKRRGREV